jgi:hypothetical protein
VLSIIEFDERFDQTSLSSVKVALTYLFQRGLVTRRKIITCPENRGRGDIPSEYRRQIRLLPLTDDYPQTE